MSKGIQILFPGAEQIRRPARRPLAARLDTLEGKRIGFVYNTFASIAVIHVEIQRVLATARIRAVRQDKKYWRMLEPDQLGHLAENADAVITGLGNTSPSVACVVRDAVALEMRGRPTVTFTTAYFEDLFSETAAAEGMPDLRRVILPSSVEGLPDAALSELGRSAVDHVVAALTRADAPAVVRV